MKRTAGCCLFRDEWLDTAAEEKFGRLRWLAPDDAITPSAVEARPPEEAPDQAPAADDERRHPEGADAVGCRVGCGGSTTRSSTRGPSASGTPKRVRGCFLFCSTSCFSELTLLMHSQLAIYVCICIWKPLRRHEQFPGFEMAHTAHLCGFHTRCLCA